MDPNEIQSIREWSPLDEILNKLPTRIQKGIFPVNLNITAVDIVSKFIAFGTDGGIVFWYNRCSGEFQKLRAEISSPISCVRIVSSVEYMVAAGGTNGQVSIFQIQKELPPDLELAAPINKRKPIERYSIRDLHKSSVVECEWSKNGMKLFSGDKEGIIVLTEFDYQAHISKSVEILNEAYEIVQLAVFKSNLLVSSVYRTIICQLDQKTNQWQVSQVGKKDRKYLSDFGADFIKPNENKLPKLICSRPGLRFWLSDLKGNVEQTLMFKEIINTSPRFEIPTLNPSRRQQNTITNFRKVKMLTEKHAITIDETSLYILNLEHLEIEAIARGFKKIIDFCIHGKEIFILEGPRSVIRLSSVPEPPTHKAKIIFNPLLPPSSPTMGLNPLLYESPIEYEAEDEIIANAEECFESLPIEQIESTTTPNDLESPGTQLSRRIEIFNQISKMDFEESILHHTEKKKTNINECGKKKSKNKNKAPKTRGIVEIGHQMSEDNIATQSCSKQTNKDKLNLELTTNAVSLDASFCHSKKSIIDPIAMTPNTLQKILEPKEKALAAELQLQHYKNETLTEETLKEPQYHTNPVLPATFNWQYPLTYKIPKLEDVEVQTTPRKKLHFINDCNDSPSPKSVKSDFRISNFEKLYENLDRLEIYTECSGGSINNESQDYENLRKPLQFVECQPMTHLNSNTSLNSIPKVAKVPLNLKIPSIWNIRMESNGESSGDSNTSSEWEFVNN